ncbi:haloacid dehalogenase-like hydrolase [Gammaproteobacteria bacterium]|nr:haloacid dehalogenase-like hydrolase [Gammaproteobacteria bacterium]
MIKVYDFDKTLTYVDTTMMFLFYCCNDLKQRNIKKLLIIIFAVFHKFKILSNNNFKSLAYGLVLKGRKEKEIVNISKFFVKENSDIFNLLGYKVRRDTNKQSFVVTASPQLYVQMYFNNMIVIGTTFTFDADNIFNGIEFNCYGTNKVIALKEAGVDEVDEFFTDSFSDIPVMNISKKVFLVKKDIIRKL